MTSLFTKAAFAALIGLGAIATVPSVAQPAMWVCA